MKYLPWRLTLLGSLRAETNDGTASLTRFRSQKTASLLAYLASYPDRSHPREELSDRFWPEDDVEAGRNSLRVALAALRRDLEPSPLPRGSVIATDRFAVGFVPGAIACDVVNFEAAIRRANRAGCDDGELRAAALEEAVAVYAGPLLPGFYDDWICEERERLHVAFAEALKRLADHYEVRQDMRRALDFAQRLAGAQGADPADPLSQRVERLRLLATEADTKSTRDAAEAASRPYLPRPTDCLVGRETVQEELLGLLNSFPAARLVTLTGPGGAGKTRLALEAAQTLQSKYGGGNVCFVPLVEVNDPSRILEAIRDALRLPRNTADESPKSLLDQTLQRLNAASGPNGSDSFFLLVLDNFEQLTERNGTAASGVIDCLLRGAARLQCLVTSRRRVGVAGERLFAVPPLALPDINANRLTPESLHQVASVALFVDRACGVNPDFCLTESNVATVAELCVRLEGLPLAIELAAAWSGSLSPTAMLTRLDERFALLASVRGQDKTDRHRSLWATIAWSFDLLPSDLQQFWLRLSVFRGGWTAESAAIVCGGQEISERMSGVHEALARLRERSLIVPQGEDPNGEIRFTLLESLREWAARQMDADESMAAQERHAIYFRNLTDAAREKMRGSEEKTWLDRFDSDHDNLRVACDFYHLQGRFDEPSAQAGLIFVSALSLFWRKRGYLREARQRIDDFLDLPLSAQFPLERGKALNSIGLVAWMQNDLLAASAYFEDGLAIFHAIGDTVGIGKVLSNLSLIAMERNDYAKVTALSEESLALHRKTEDRLSEAMCLGNLGNVHLETNNYAEGRRYHGDALAIYRELGDNEGITIALSGLAYAAVHCGNRVEARRLFHEALVIRHALNDLWRICFSLTSIADFLLQEDSALAAAQLYGAAEALRLEIGAPFSDNRQAEFDSKCAEIVTLLGQSEFEAAYKAGQNLSRTEAVELALACCR